VERVKAGIARARSQGVRVGRQPFTLEDGQLRAVAHLSLRQAAQQLGVSRSVVHRHRRALSRKPLSGGAAFASDR
jgi:hypothetical protein